jgi:hypothetical protein
VEAGAGRRRDRPLRRVYDLRHTFATFALRAGISTFDLSRYMGASLTVIDRHYGHLARDGREHAIRLLDELSAEERPPWTLVDAAWTPDSAADSQQQQRKRLLSRQKVEALFRTRTGDPLLTIQGSSREARTTGSPRPRKRRKPKGSDGQS